MPDELAYFLLPVTLKLFELLYLEMYVFLMKSESHGRKHGVC